MPLFINMMFNLYLLWEDTYLLQEMQLELSLFGIFRYESSRILAFLISEDDFLLCVTVLG